MNVDDEELIESGEANIRVRCRHELLEMCRQYGVNASIVSRGALVKAIRRAKRRQRMQDRGYTPVLARGIR